MLKKNKDPGRYQIGRKPPSLHGNNSEFGANEVNSFLFWIITCQSMPEYKLHIMCSLSIEIHCRICMSSSLVQSFNLSIPFEGPANFNLAQNYNVYFISSNFNASFLIVRKR